MIDVKDVVIVLPSCVAEQYTLLTVGVATNSYTTSLFAATTLLSLFVLSTATMVIVISLFGTSYKVQVNGTFEFSVVSTDSAPKPSAPLTNSLSNPRISKD